ncbi:MAG: SCO family protein [Acidobacteria bacterium]|nr:SCO family protein [Acidobacteriota bacterium]
MKSRALAFALITLFAATMLRAQGYSADKPIGATAQETPAYLAHAGIEQRLGHSLPMSTTFTDETGRTGALSTWFHDKPVVMAEVYYNCAMLCPQVLHGLATGLGQTTLLPGKDYQVLVFSIDPMDTPADAVAKEKTFLSEAHWTNNPQAPGAVHFLTGTPASIASITSATGFHYVRVPGPDGKLDQFAHSSVIMFATPDGKLSKYISGIDYQPRDIRMALLDASQKKISNPVDLLILYCCSYSPTVGRYSVSVLHILSIAGMLTLLIVVGMIFLLTRKPKGSTA